MSDELVCVDDFEAVALKKLNPVVRDYYKGGAGDEHTLRLNIDTFRKYRIRPRVLVDVSKRDISTTVLGTKISMPLGVSPTALQKMAHPDGECASARAAAAAGTVFILSMISTTSLEDVAAAAPDGIKWFQLFISKNRDVTMGLVRKAERAGFKALVLTVDSPVYGDKRADRRNKFSLPSHLSLGIFDRIEKPDSVNSNKTPAELTEYWLSSFDVSVEWDDVKWLKSITKLPIVLKGILTADDAILGVEHGASAILVSNHGARQIDGCPSTIEALPEIVKAVGDKAEVYLDGGVRQGTDVFKALALGAKMVFVGRPMLWGLAVGGEKGARRILELLRSEIDLLYGLSGCTKTADVTPAMIAHESYYSRL